MTTAAERSITSRPGHMESHPTQRALAHPRCTLQALHPEDLEQTMCDAIHDDDARKRLVRTDAQAFRLHVEFVHAHGIPKGEVTTFTTVGEVASDEGTTLRRCR